ncbi:hypothetical protein BDM02DRAFT_3190128 [Thelephora ganbajun]|uniref:Uncharacterized protein n=1 Tax=Thelephora ganbajun TaxID=370292 RepID=A0ACB6Z5C7_THEGA|nr:hypothetical protein BDM02DRAFT_3190128 [Thelephora ganbajun]
MERDPMEEDLLAQLEDLAQKTDVLTRWADEMYEFVKAIPIKPLPDHNKLERHKDEADKQANKRKNADIQAEYNAMVYVALYMLLMSFPQRGIGKLAGFQEHMEMKYSDGKSVASEGPDDDSLDIGSITFSNPPRFRWKLIFPTSNQRPGAPSVTTHYSSCPITRTTDDNAISSPSYLYPGDPRTIAPSRSSSLRRTSSMTGLDEEFQTAPFKEVRFSSFQSLKALSFADT